MIEITTFLIGIAAGFFLHAVGMKVSFKQRVIENKIEVYDSLITNWVRCRNYIYCEIIESENPDNKTYLNFDQMYGESHTSIAEAILLCDDNELTDGINLLNEKIYRTEWSSLEIDKANILMEDIKVEAFKLVASMRENIIDSSIFTLRDIKHIVTGMKYK